MSVLHALAQFTVNLRYEDVPDVVCDTAKNAILDTIGVALAAVREPVAPLLRELAMVNGALRQSRTLLRRSRKTHKYSTIIGLDCSAPPAIAALVNGALAHALDFDDISDTMGGHPSVPMLPAALAIAENTAAGGRDLLAAYVAGFEVELRISRGLNFVHYDRGWHPTATIGVFGATAAAARLAKLSVEETVRALAIACSMSAGIKSNFGTMTKPLQVGQAAHNGVIASQAAKLGMSSSPDAFDGPQGFANVYNGPGTYDLETITANFGGHWELEDPGLVIKQYPCCGSTHPVVDAALAIRHEYKLDAHDIESVEIFLHPRRLKHTNRPRPRGGLECKFSVQYAVATALAEGEVRLRHFTEEAPGFGLASTILERTHAAELPEERWGPQHFAGEVHIKMLDGTVYDRRVEKARGRGAMLALTQGEINRKFLDCATGILPETDAQTLLQSLRHLEECAQIDQVMNMIARLMPESQPPSTR